MTEQNEILKLRKELEGAQAAFQQLMAANQQRCRVTAGQAIDGLQVMVMAAKAGDPGAMTDLENTRNVLRAILSDDPRSRIAVVRG